MAEVAKRYSEQLDRIKKLVEKSYEYFRPNYDRFNFFRRFTFETALDAETIALLKTLKKPQIEFNICEAYVSRLRGEFSKQEPSIEIMAGDEKPVDPATIEVVQGHILHSLSEAKKEGFEYNIYTDTLSGGFSTIKMYTDYVSAMSMKQCIKLERVFDPCLTGFDPLAKLPHKGDGRYCFELFPKCKEDFEREYPNIDISKVKFQRDIGGFNWSYKYNNDEILLICDFYEKKSKRVKIFELADGSVKTEDDYKDFLAEWEQSGRVEVPPAIVGKPRYTEIDTIVRYRFIENKVLEYVETDYSMLPLIFVDGNSIMLRHGVTSAAQQMCRPYVYNARGIQRLKNFAGQCLANELENMIEHKWMVAKEAIPLEEEYLEAYRNVQQADVLVYNAFRDDDPKVQVPPPQTIQRVPIPPEITNTFQSTDQLAQTILGNFDMDLGRLNKSQVSGVAVQESITQSNSAAMPFVVGYLQALSRVGEIFIDLIPKYYKTPRTIPVLKPDGKKDYAVVNQPNGVNLQYASNALNVKVEPGVNFSVQKQRALMQIIELMQASPLFAQFMNTEGLEVLLSNIEIKGIDQIREMAKMWMQQQRQQAQQMAQQPNPAVMKMQVEQGELQHKVMKTQTETQIAMAKLQKDYAQMQADLQALQLKTASEIHRGQVEIRAKQIESSHNKADMAHRHVKEATELHHAITMDHRKQAHEEHIASRETTKGEGTRE